MAYHPTVSILLLHFSILFLLFVQGRIVFDRPSKWNNVPGWPAVKIRLTRRGAEHVKFVGVKILNDEIPRLSGFTTQHSFSEHGITGTVQLFDVHVLRYSPPQFTSLEFAPPSYVILILDRMDVALAGRFMGTVALIPVSGSVTGDIRQMTVRLQTQFKTAPDGLMQVKVVDCSTIVQYSHFSISVDGALNGFVKTIEAQINEIIRQRIPSVFCNSLQRVIEGSSPRLFQRLAYTDLSDPFRTTGPVDNLVVERILRRFISGLYIDNRNIADPIVTPNYFETQQRGEIRYEGDYRTTPFNPPPMHTRNDSSRMLYLYGSEYLFNSLLYHAYENDRMIVEVDETILPPQFKAIVRTSCNKSSNDGFMSSLCLGTLIPEIAVRYPNRTSSFLLLPHQVPEFQLSNGVGSIDLKSRVLTYTNEGYRRRQILVSAADLQADLRLLVEDQKFAAALKLNKFDVRLHRSAIKGLNSDSIAQLAPLAKTFLGPQLAKALRKGVPFPLKDSVQFINPQLTVHDKFVEIATDFQLGEWKLREKIKEAFATSFPQLLDA